MRAFLLVLLLSASQIGQAQSQTDIYAHLGLNRIGVFYGTGAQHNWGVHHLQVGLRFYEPDLVFEKGFPGLDVGYYYRFRADKTMKINLGLMSSFFYEYKGSSALWLFDPKLIVGAGWTLTPKLNLNLNGGFGSVINVVETSYGIENNKFTYLNYELSLGIYYRLGGAVAP